MILIQCMKNFWEANSRSFGIYMNIGNIWNILELYYNSLFVKSDRIGAVGFENVDIAQILILDFENGDSSN